MPAPLTLSQFFAQGMYPNIRLLGPFAVPRYNHSMKAHVWVMPKRTVLDPQGQTIQHALSGLGYAAITDVRQGKFFVLNLDGWSRDEAQKQLEKISKDVLTNPVIEEYRFEIVD
jgi:phosphoribosylformylglycinamidine synthase subunit PurS